MSEKTERPAFARGRVESESEEDGADGGDQESEESSGLEDDDEDAYVDEDEEAGQLASAPREEDAVFK